MVGKKRWVSDIAAEIIVRFFGRKSLIDKFGKLGVEAVAASKSVPLDRSFFSQSYKKTKAHSSTGNMYDIN